jgi:hypothetical protein
MKPLDNGGALTSSHNVTILFVQSFITLWNFPGYRNAQGPKLGHFGEKWARVLRKWVEGGEPVRDGGGNERGEVYDDADESGVNSTAVPCRERERQ